MKEKIKMDKAVHVAEKCYYFYQKSPKVVKWIIRLIYQILATIYKIIRKRKVLMKKNKV